MIGAPPLFDICHDFGATYVSVFAHWDCVCACMLSIHTAIPFLLLSLFQNSLLPWPDLYTVMS